MGREGKPGLNDVQVEQMLAEVTELQEKLDAIYQTAREVVPVNSVAFNRLDKAHSAMKSLKSFLYNQSHVRRSV